MHFKTFFKRTRTICCSTMLLCLNADAHEADVHREITAQAVDDSFIFRLFMDSIFHASSEGEPIFTVPPAGGIFPEVGVGPKNAKEWVMEGSVREDDGYEFTQRAYNHFYDPYTKGGLSDLPVISGFLGTHLVGTDSFTWATNPELDASMVGNNSWTWRNARHYEYLALTLPLASNRNLCFAEMFRSVGQVIHLLQDTSQPEHVRNNEHVTGTPDRSYIEEWGQKDNHYKTILDDPTSLNRANIFPYPSLENGLKSLWDRDELSKEAGGAVNLTPKPDNRLGLAEFTNKNYLGKRSLYEEFYRPSDIHHYAHPSLGETDVQAVLNAFGTVGVEDVKGPDNKDYTAIYISKVSNGLKVIHHSRLTYLESKAAVLIPPHVSATHGRYYLGGTIHDDAVVEEYLRVLLPLAVNYSTACIDYFFRAGLWCETTWDNYSQVMVVYIHNNSPGLCTLKGGEFEMYWDDENGTRHKFDDFVYDKNELKFGEFATGTFRAPPGKIQSRNCMVVYKGNALQSESSTADPVDNGIAIAACQAWLPAILQVLDRNTTIQVTIAGVQGHSKSSAIVDVSGINSTLTFRLGNVFIATFYSPDVVSGVTVGYEMIDSPPWSEKYYDTVSQQMKTITGHFEGDLYFPEWEDNNPHPEISCWIHSALEGFSSDSASGTSDQIILQNRNDPTTTEGGINGTATVLLKTN